MPLQTSLPPAPEHLLKVIRCNCQADCSTRRCTCKRHNIEHVVTAGDLVAQMFFMTMMKMMTLISASQTTVTIEMSFIQLTAVFVSSRVTNAGA